MLELDVADLDTLGVGALVEHLLHLGIELLAFRQHLIEVVLPDDRTQRCLRKLAGCRFKVLDLIDGLFSDRGRGSIRPR